MWEFGSKAKEISQRNIVLRVNGDSSSILWWQNGAIVTPVQDQAGRDLFQDQATNHWFTSIVRNE